MRAEAVVGVNGRGRESVAGGDHREQQPRRDPDERPGTQAPEPLPEPDRQGNPGQNQNADVGERHVHADRPEMHRKTGW
jgi:hypothetical protein